MTPEQAMDQADSASDVEARRIARAFLLRVTSARNAADRGSLGAAVRSPADRIGVDLAIPPDLFAGMVFSDLLQVGKKAEDEEDLSILARLVLIGFLLARWTLGRTIDDDEYDRVAAVALVLATRRVSEEAATQLAAAARNSNDALNNLLDRARADLAVAPDAQPVDILRILNVATLLFVYGINTRQVSKIIERARARILAGTPSRIVRDALRKEAAAAIRERAQTIGGTIADRAINAAQFEFFRAYFPGEAFKRWVARGDACFRCLAFNGIRVPMDQPFVSTRGEVAMYPDVHPNGRCRMTAEVE